MNFLVTPVGSVFPFTATADTKRSLFSFTLILASILGLFQNYCFAGGLFHVFTPSIEGTLCPVARPSCLVSKTVVTVSESYVEVSTDQVFLNDNDYSLDSVFILPLAIKGPHNVSEVLVNGENAVFDVLKPRELFPILKKITCEAQDPAPLALCGYDAIICPGIKIGIKESKSFRITYRAPFVSRDDVMDMTIPMVGERYAMNPVGEYEVLVRFKMSRSVRTSFCTSNDILTENESTGRRLVVCNQEGIRSPEDFRLVTTFGGPDLNLRILCHKAHSNDGYLMAIIEPPQIKKSDEPPLSDIAILLDCSNSISHEDLESGKKAVGLLLGKLRHRDRFDVICFTSKPKRIFDGLVEARRKNLSLAMNFVETFRSSGGTDIYNTILAAFDLFDSKKRPGMILLVTDGKATIGKTNPEALIEMVRHYNKSKIRIFIVAVGPSPDVATLDQIAKITGGAILQVPKSKNFESLVSAWLSNMISPSVTELAVNLKGLSGEGFVPDPAPEIIGQESVAIFGHYHAGTGSGITVDVKGKIGSRTRDLSKKVDLPTEEKSYDFIPTLWAMRKMAGMLDLERTKGQNPKLTSQIKRLSSLFGLKTCDVTLKFEKLFADLLWKYKTSFVPSDVTANGIKRVEEKIFKHDAGQWVELTLEKPLPQKEIKFLSEEYFDLVLNEAKLGSVLALGTQVCFIHNDANVKIVNSEAGK